MTLRSIFSVGVSMLVKGLRSSGRIVNFWERRRREGRGGEGREEKGGKGRGRNGRDPLAPENLAGWHDQ